MSKHDALDRAGLHVEQLAREGDERILQSWGETYTRDGLSDWGCYVPGGKAYLHDFSESGTRIVIAAIETAIRIKLAFASVNNTSMFTMPYDCGFLRAALRIEQKRLLDLVGSGVEGHATRCSLELNRQALVQSPVGQHSCFESGTSVMDRANERTEVNQQAGVESCLPSQSNSHEAEITEALKRMGAK